MPTPASPGTNQYPCDACGRHLNSEGELTEHARECVAAKQSGSGDTRAAGAHRLERLLDADLVLDRPLVITRGARSGHPVVGPALPPAVPIRR